MLARLTQSQGQAAAALQMLDQAEGDLGPSLEIQLARLDYWAMEGGDAAKAAVAKLALARSQLHDTDRPVFLDRLAAVEMRLGEQVLARQYWRELAGLSRPISKSSRPCLTWPCRPATMPMPRISWPRFARSKATAARAGASAKLRISSPRPGKARPRTWKHREH